MTAPITIDAGWHPLVAGCPPDWASGWGHDEHGVYVDLTLERITQRLRWVPPGQFQMGSRETEPGRFEWEGPRHWVTIAEGFWLFDTPVTQALWRAVIGDNPSEFAGPDRPIETVSWNEAQMFLREINERVKGLDLVLPSEAQWEYACRAGTETATYAGAIEILGENHAPVLDAIAWYGGNSGADFDLAEGWDSSSWREKQYAHDKAGTHPVGLKAPNAWGLYDMLGNVWEWCEDHWHDSYEGAPSDGSAWLDEGGTADRVIRGGSWLGDARYVRAACRRRDVPGVRLVDLGFRCARVQV